MADHQPTRSAGDEREVLLAALQYQRESFLRNVEGLAGADARRAPVASGTTLLWLTKHLAFAEQIWLRVRLAGAQVDLDNEVRDGDTLEGVIAAYVGVWAISDEIIRSTDLDAAIPDPNGGAVPVTLRWIVVHLLQEVARHAGHADILRELIDGQTGR
jgi:hypothetical protein